ncbi:hypothetical protein G9A89_007322 [Geosiphon pyriformis]|nr:hypothetical protein G9A89_007322 [Geosiphon pyriformis]
MEPSKPKLKCLVCNKKLLFITACSASDEDPRNSTHYYCNYCNKEKYGYPEKHRKWDKEPCLALRERTPFEAVFNRALRRLQHYSHDKNELYNTTQAKKMSAKIANKVTNYNMFDPLCPTHQEQEQYFVQINTYFCEDCLIPCQSQCCKKYQYKRDLARKMENKNQQYQNQSINQQDLPDSSESEKFVAYTNLEQEINIQYFDNGHLKIIPKRAYLTNAGFNLCYSENQFTTLPPRSITKIDLKIVIEIPPEIMV